MRNPCIRVALVGALLTCWSAAGWAQPAQVLVPTGAWSSAPAPLLALVFQPVGAGTPPAVVMVHGCGVVLDAISHPSEAAQPGFRAAVSFYPGCTARNQHAERFHPSAPLLVLMGEADDWTPAAPCKTLAATAAARGETMEIVTYPATFHDFDTPALKAPRRRTDVPNGVQPGAGVTVAPNPIAREDAKRRVSAFLANHFQ